MRELTVMASVFAVPAIAHAHGLEAAASDYVWVGVLLLASAGMYARGVATLWRHAGVGRGIRRVHAVRFALGWALLAVALLSPLDEIAAHSFAAHMVQHELLMVAAAPLIVLSRPLEAWAWAVPATIVRRLRVWVSARAVRRAWRATTGSIGASVTHAVALWAWHLPTLFIAALASVPLHALQHACFFASALAFWWAVLGGGRTAPGAASVACLFTTMLHTSLLGALITFAPTVWYMRASDVALLGMTPLEDQQLGGLVMWVPGGLPYLAAGLAIVGSWLGAPRAQRESA